MTPRFKLRLLVALLPLHLQEASPIPKHSISKKILRPTVIAMGKSFCPLERLGTSTNFSGSVVASENRVAPNTELETPKADSRVDEL